MLFPAIFPESSSCLDHNFVYSWNHPFHPNSAPTTLHPLPHFLPNPARQAIISLLSINYLYFHETSSIFSFSATRLIFPRPSCDISNFLTSSSVSGSQFTFNVSGSNRASAPDSRSIPPNIIKGTASAVHSLAMEKSLLNCRCNLWYGGLI
jgi:hypothetical protein